MIMKSKGMSCLTNDLFKYLLQEKDIIIIDSKNDINGNKIVVK